MTTVAIIEDNHFILKSFTEIINNSEDFTVIGSFKNCEDALKAFENTSPDIIMVDIQLPGIDGIEGIKRFRVQNPTSKTLIVSVHQESSYIFNALSAGAIGYLTKNISPIELIQALKQILSGGSPMSSGIARKVVAYFQTPQEAALSKRENEVLHILAKGKSYAAIAQELNVSVNTIKTHTRNIYEKLHVSSRDEIIQKFS